MADRRDRALEIIAAMLPPDDELMSDRGRTVSVAPEFGEMALNHVFEPLWTRPGLDLKVRSLLTVALLIALRAKDELAIHIPAAVRNGATVAEIEELIYHAAAYVGFPAAASAREVAEAALTASGMVQSSAARGDH